MEERRIKLRGIQRVVAHKMEQSHQIPRVTTIREVRMDQVASCRKQLNQKDPEHKVSFMTFAIKGLIQAVKEYPVLNAYLDGEEIVYHDDINISMAVTVGENLVTPVLKNTQNMSFTELNNVIAETTLRARNGKLTKEDYADGTITISNSGSLGGEIFTPLINFPQSAILGIGRIVKKPVVDEKNKIEVCPMMYLCLTYDHRIINGSQAVGALSVIDNYFKNPTV